MAAGILSILAVCKLFLEYHKLETPVSSNKVLFRVGIRCVLYTLGKFIGGGESNNDIQLILSCVIIVPFIVNVWSFIMQLTEFHADDSNYPLVFIDAFLSSCCGTFYS